VTLAAAISIVDRTNSQRRIFAILRYRASCRALVGPF
jgi:hypothetical protein